MKTILITAPASGSGKTTITVGIIRALLNKGIDVCAFKTGPDYIDRAFLEKASKKRAGNLDMHLQGKDGLRSALAMSSAEYCIIEGAMGYFDGIGSTYINSSYDISRELDIHSVLIYTPKGEMFSAIPKMKGLAEFKDSNIKAVIFNQVAEKQYKMLREALEEHTGLKALGYIPKIEEAEFKSRHLGLVQSSEITDLEGKIDAIAAVVHNNIDMDGLMKLMKNIELPEAPKVRRRNLKAAIAMDHAFSFYYSENIRLLEMACEVVYFSPIKDNAIPSCDFLFLGGGYPEVFAAELAYNKSMLNSIKAYSQNGGYIYSECGGFMYLNEMINTQPMVGVFKGSSEMTKGLQRFGYIDLELEEHCFLGNRGDKITAHEFHKSTTHIEDKAIFKISKTMGDASWACGYLYKNTYGGYPHINFLGNMN
ncbi:MAG TPA: cobyrinate a,c-diamide synthase, partial [Patescibacteria group bacterium]|nr:cobyrinate a,c-diamide synthase [Patescibacteria group bacterium]